MSDKKDYVAFMHPKRDAGGPKVGAGGGGGGVVVIGSIDKPALEVAAQYNPKELQVDKSVPWQKNPQSNKSPKAGIQLEFTGAEGRSMSLEMLFDKYEKGESVAPEINMLNDMASPIDAGSNDENLRRPHLCAVVWGSTIPRFTCVIESVSTKYTMFSSTGDPLRATCTVKLKEANSVKMKAEDGDGGGSTSPAKSGT
jgi:hypothetical protein